jgi:sugar lactone lactonase YvrE
MVSPDHTLLTVSDPRGRFCWSFSIAGPGKLIAKQEYGWLHLTDHGRSDADGVAVDTEGRVYVTTALGLQVLDQLGRVNLILSKPTQKWLSNVTFGGENGDMLYVTCGDSVWKRKIRAKGIQTIEAPIKPPRPGL